MREHRGSFRLVPVRHGLYIIIYIRCARAVCIQLEAQAEYVSCAMYGRVILTPPYCADTQRVVKRPISQRKTARIAARFGPFRKPGRHGMPGRRGRAAS